MKVLAASRSEGMCPDAIRSLSELAVKSESNERRLEDLIANIEPSNEAEASALERLKGAIANQSYLD